MLCLIFMGFHGKFGITLRTRFRKSILCPAFKIEQPELPLQSVDLMPSPFKHDELNFENSYEKILSADEIESGWLMLANTGFFFSEYALQED